MGRTIKLLLLYFAYQLAFFAVLVGVYMLKNGVVEMPDVSGSGYMSVIMWAQFLSTLSVGLHVVLGKYVSIDVFRLKTSNRWAVLFASSYGSVGGRTAVPWCYTGTSYAKVENALSWYSGVFADIRCGTW